MLPETALEYLKISRNLIEGFNEHLDRESLEIRTRANDAYVKAGMVLGLAVHAHQMGALALDLLERDTPIVLVAPTIRVCFESALTAQWIAMSTDAAKAMFNKEVNQRRAMQKTLTDARSNTMQQLADRVAHTDLRKLVTSSRDQAKFFEQMLGDFDGGGPDAYAYFRMLSTFTHASASLVDRYLEEDSDPEIPFMRLTPSLPGNAGILARTTTLSMSASIIIPSR